MSMTYPLGIPCSTPIAEGTSAARWALSLVSETPNSRTVVCMRCIDSVFDAKLQDAIDKGDDRVGVVGSPLNIHRRVPSKETAAVHKVDSFSFKKEWVATVAAREIVEAR